MHEAVSQLANWREVREEVGRGGFRLFEGAFDEFFCARVKTFIDELPAEQTEVNYGGSEVRIWRAHEKNADVAAFSRFADEALSQAYGKSVRCHDVLAIRNLPVPDREELLRGRWHLDSLRQQVKVFLFLTDVTERTGPLEILPGSHRTRFKVSGVGRGQLLHVADFLGMRRRYQRLDDRWVGEVSQKSGGSHAIICSAGTAAIVDTSAVHRARPCLENSRYALTAYYDHF